jgi:tetratricopeptide (TPR) repeat protein
MPSANTTKNINRRSIEIPSNIENIRLIYLDNSQVNQQIQLKLLEINPAVQFYTDIQLCIDFIKSIFNEKIFLIISNNLSLDLLESISLLQSILAIFIYDNNNNINQEINNLKSQYPKIIDRYTNENDLLRSIEEKIQFIEKQTFVYSLFNEKQNLTKESASFLWYQMLINILKQIPQNENVCNEMLNKYSDYYQTNRYELEKIELFHKNYTREQAIQWYINEYFLYKLLNYALCTKNIQLLYSFRFFIIDLCFEIEKQYEYIKNQGNLIVYRAQILSNKEIEKLKKHIGCLISTNGFLLTSRNKNLTLEFFQQNFSINENVLFEINIDLSIETIILADISSFSSMPWKNEILFYINSLFKIDSVEYDTINKIWNIKMTSSNDGTKRINKYLKLMQKEMDYHSPIIYFGHLLWNELGQINQAEIFFQILLKSLSNDHKDIPSIYIELGNINDEMEEYNLALKNYQYALDIREKQIPKDYIRIALLLNNIGVVYQHMGKGNIDRAIEYYRQSLDIYETKCSKDENRFHRANTIVNLGSAYRDKNDFDTALTYLTLAYNIRRDILPNDHPLLTNSLNSIGNIYNDKHDFNQALSYYQQALSIQEITYPDDHLNKANTIRNIGLVYRDKQDWTNALNYFKRTLQMRQRLLSNTNDHHHPDIAICYGDLGNIYEKMNNLDLALDYYQQQYEIEEACLPINHPNLIIHFDWIINILKKKDQIDKAIEFCQEKLSYLKTILENEYKNHPRTARILVLLASIYEDKNPKDADQYYQQALEILEHNKNEEISIKSLSTMTNFYWKCRMFDRALICQMKLLNLRRSTLLSNDNDIAYTLRGLARLYRAMNKTNQALEYFEQSLTILQTNFGSEHIDVKNIQKEIFDLKDIIKSLASSANEDYNYRRTSSIHKQLFISQTNLKSSEITINQPSISVSKSSTCIIL